MKGVILAGGNGTRLRPLTLVTNKHLLPIYDRSMIEYPLKTLTRAGITDIIVVSGREHAGHFLNYLGSGVERGLNFTFRVQEEAGGIAEALNLAEVFIGKEKFAVILGDNIFEDDFSDVFNEFESRDDVNCSVFIKQVESPQRFGVVQFGGDGPSQKIERIIEKPQRPPSKYAVTGLYLYDSNAFDVIKTLKPSGRGELEITDLNNWYLQNKNVVPSLVENFWSDAGTFQSMMDSSIWAQQNNGKIKETN